jgi:hypothetical protein
MIDPHLEKQPILHPTRDRAHAPPVDVPVMRTVSPVPRPQGLRTRAKRTTGKQGLRYTPSKSAHYKLLAQSVPPQNPRVKSAASVCIRCSTMCARQNETAGTTTRRRTMELAYRDTPITTNSSPLDDSRLHRTECVFVAKQSHSNPQKPHPGPSLSACICTSVLTLSWGLPLGIQIQKSL